MFHGLTALGCAACEASFEMEIRLLKDLNNSECVSFYNKISSQGTLCKNCTGALDGK